MRQYLGRYYPLVIFLGFSQFYLAQADSKRTSIENILVPEDYLINYNISSEGKDIGHITHRRITTENGLTIAEMSEINISGWWGKINIDSNFIDTYDLEGNLLSSDNKVRDGKTAHHLVTLLESEYYQASYRKLKKVTKNERDALNQLNKLIGSDAHNASGHLIGLSNSIFADRMEISEGGKFSVKELDTTSAYLPIFLQKNFHRVIQQKIKVYDTEELEISYYPQSG